MRDAFLGYLQLVRHSIILLVGRNSLSTYRLTQGTALSLSASLLAGSAAPIYATSIYSLLNYMRRVLAGDKPTTWVTRAELSADAAERNVAREGGEACQTENPSLTTR